MIEQSKTLELLSKDSLNSQKLTSLTFLNSHYMTPWHLTAKQEVQRWLFSIDLNGERPLNDSDLSNQSKLSNNLKLLTILINSVIQTLSNLEVQQPFFIREERQPSIWCNMGVRMQQRRKQSQLALLLVQSKEWLSSKTSSYRKDLTIRRSQLSELSTPLVKSNTETNSSVINSPSLTTTSIKQFLMETQPIPSNKSFQIQPSNLMLNNSLLLN